MKEQYLLTIDRPDGVLVSEMSEYIKEAISIWAQGGHPDDLLFGHFLRKGNTPKVKRIKTFVQDNGSLRG